MSKDTIFFDFSVIGSDGIFPVVRSEIVPDCGSVQSGPMVDDMPVRLVLYARASIEVIAQAMDAVQNIGLVAEPCVVRIGNEDMSCTVSATAAAEDAEVRIGFVAREEKRVAISAEKLLIKMLESALPGQMNVVLRQEDGGEVVLSASSMKPITEIMMAASDSIELNVTANPVALTSTTLEDGAISFVSSTVGAVVAYYRTISDLGTDTLADVGGLTLSKLFFTEVR